jgi:hypothetical protein
MTASNLQVNRIPMNLAHKRIDAVIFTSIGLLQIWPYFCHVSVSGISLAINSVN